MRKMGVGCFCDFNVFGVMKKANLTVGIILLITSNIMISCVTAMDFDKSAALQESMHGINTEMEFIGFKGTYDTLGNDYSMWQNFKKDTVLARLGTILQDKGIAYDQSFAYFGIYSLQEIAAYKSKQRFVTFVETEKNNFTYTYSDKNQKIWGSLAGGFLGFGITTAIIGSSWTNNENLKDLGKIYRNMGIGVSIAGAVCLIPALIPAKTTITFNGVYSIYVYDTENKEIIYKDTVNVGPLLDRYNGSYEDSGTDKNAVWNYYSTLAFNEIIKKYGEIYQFLGTKK